MKYVTIGKELRVSHLCFGTMYFGTKTDRITSFRLLDHFMDAGGNFIDTANNYAFWMENGYGNESEEMIGRWFRESGKRGDVVLATKVGARPKHPGDGPDNLEGLSYKTIIEAVEGSLQRLQTDYIDVYYSHVDWPNHPLDERLEAFDRLYKEGKIRASGTSNLFPWRLEKSLNRCGENDWLRSCCVQLKHSYLRPAFNADLWVQKQIDAAWLDFASLNRDQQLIGYSPLLSGAYSGRPWPEGYLTRDNMLRMQTLKETARKLQVSANQLVLAWMLHGSPPVLPLISASSVNQLAHNLSVSDIQLDNDSLQVLNEAGETGDSLV